VLVRTIMVRISDNGLIIRCREVDDRRGGLPVHDLVGCVICDRHGCIVRMKDETSQTSGVSSTASD
jgi:hypothetical protein